MSTLPTDYPGSGGWRAGLYRDRTKLYPDIPFLAAEKYTVKPSGCTFRKAASTPAAAEVQSLASSGASAGTFTLAFEGSTTTPLAFNATAAAVQAALQALPTVGVGGITAAGGPANTTAITLTFAGTLATRDQPLLVLDKTGLTGGGAAVVTETTRGAIAGVSQIKKGTFCIPDLTNVGYYKPWVTGDAIDDNANGISGYLMESINVADGDVTEGILIQGVVRKFRVTPSPVPAAITTACAGRIIHV